MTKRVDRLFARETRENAMYKEQRDALKISKVFTEQLNAQNEDGTIDNNNNSNNQYIKLQNMIAMAKDEKERQRLMEMMMR